MEEKNSPSEKLKTFSTEALQRARWLDYCW